jgi:thiamine biosynthesis lipoprotein
MRTKLLVRNFCAALMIAVLMACRGGDRDPLLHVTGPTMGTQYNVKIVDAPADPNAMVIKAGVESILNQVNRQMSTYRTDSELTRFNNNSNTDWIDTSTDLLDVVEAAFRVSRLTKGAFDVTVGPLVNLWGFGPDGRRNKPPTTREVREVLSHIGYEKVSIRRSPPAIRKSNANIHIDLSAIAKGYAVDRIADYLDSLALTNYLVEIGGDLKASGHNINGTPWAIAIEKPSAEGRMVQRVVHITDQAMATSGDYRNYFERNGQRFSHTINPLNGSPVTHNLASVTVWSATAMDADAMATALMVLGPEAGYKLAHRRKLGAYFVMRTNKGFTEKSTLDLGQ